MKEVRQPNAYSIERGYYYQEPPASLTRLFLIAGLFFVAIMASLHVIFVPRLESALATGVVKALPLPAETPRAARPSLGINAILTKIAGREAHVSCQLEQTDPNLDILGQASLGGDEAELTPEMCRGLTRFDMWKEIDWKCVRLARVPCSEQVNRSVLALQVLTHEAYHLRGFADERVVDCYALQGVSYAAATLGASSAEAAAVARYLHGFYNMVRMPAPGYELTADCRDGGPLDLRPELTGWPG